MTDEMTKEDTAKADKWIYTERITLYLSKLQKRLLDKVVDRHEFMSANQYIRSVMEADMKKRGLKDD